MHAVQVGVGGPTAYVGLFTMVAVVQVGSLFSSDAWNNVTFTAGEIRNPKRNLPLSLAIGTGVVLLLYVLCNFVYLSVLPMVGEPAATTIAGRGIQFAAEDRVATAVMEQAFAGYGAKLMAAAILVSTFGCVNGMLLAGARVYYAMSQDGLFFKSVGKLSEQTKTPVNSSLGAVGVDLSAVSVRELWAAAGLCDLCGVGVLYSDDCWAVCAAAEAAGCGAAL